MSSPTPSFNNRPNAWIVFLAFLRLGLTSFGGPIAHLGYFRSEFVQRRAWLSERAYADLVALCQFLPGPASSQVGMAIGLSRAGFAGAFAAWLGFTLPSALALIAFALALNADASTNSIWLGGMLHGLECVAVAVVAQAVWGMGRALCTDTARITLAAIAACVVLLHPGAGAQLGVIVIAGLFGLTRFTPAAEAAHDPLPVVISQRTGAALLALFFALLIALPALAHAYPTRALAMVDAFYRCGALVFGGGHVVLPLLQAEVVPHGWISNDTFLAGYGAAQAMPGPLFTFAAFLGTATTSDVAGGLLCLLAIFAPSFLLVAGALPFWESLRRQHRVRAALAGVNAAVVGLLLAALYQPVWTHAIRAPTDFALTLLAFVALMFWKLPPWVVVITGAIASTVVSR